MTIRYCKDCLTKQRKIDELQEEEARLKSRLLYRERTAKEGFFGSSTPSSKVPIKHNSLEERQSAGGSSEVFI